MMKVINIRPLLLLLLLAVIQRNCSASALHCKHLVYGTTENLPSISSPTVHGATEEPTNSSSPTVNGIMEGVVLLTKTFTWLQGNMLDSYFDETKRNMENDLSNLPIKLAVKRTEIITGLSRIQDRIAIARAMLKKAANILIEYCDNVKDIIDRNDASEELLKYTARKTIVYLNSVNGILKDALFKFLEIRDEVSNTKVFVEEFSATLLNSKEKLTNEIKENKKEIQQITTEIPDLHNLFIDHLVLKQEIYIELKDTITVVCTRNLGVLCPLPITKVTHITSISIQAMSTDCWNVPDQKPDAVAKWLKVLTEKAKAVAKLQNHSTVQAELFDEWQNKIDDTYKTVGDCKSLPAGEAEAFDKWENLNSKFDNQNKLTRDIERQTELLNKINKAQESTTEYLSKADVINNYIETECDLITKRKNSLQATIFDHEDISIEAIKSSFKVIKEGIIDLKKTCTDYVNHVSPEPIIFMAKDSQKASYNTP